MLLTCQRAGIRVHVAGVFRYIYNGDVDDPAVATTRSKWEVGA